MSRGQSLRDISRVDLGGRSLREVGRLGEVARRRDGTKADPESGASSLSPPPARILILLDEESSTRRAPATFVFLRFVTCLFLFGTYPRDKNTKVRSLSGATAALDERDLKPMATSTFHQTPCLSPLLLEAFFSPQLMLFGFLVHLRGAKAWVCHLI